MASGSSTNLGTGGMATKVKAAKIVTDFGKHQIIVNGSKDNYLLDILNKEKIMWYWILRPIMMLFYKIFYPII